MKKTYYKLSCRLVFPEGVSPGEKSVANMIVVARNGQGQAVLRGTSLAGALRSAYARLYETHSDDAVVSQWFGDAAIDDEVNPSLLQINDAEFDRSISIHRTHNHIDRHSGAVIKGALFSVESLPPGCAVNVSILIKPDARLESAAEQFIAELTGLLADGLFIGGNSNRGIGRVVIDNEMYVRRFDLGSVDGMATWMDAEYKERKDGVELTGDIITPEHSGQMMQIELALDVPKGEDLLIGDGQEVDYALQPQKVICSDGSEKWRIPGSALRGVIRSWMTRLAAREGYPTCDSYMERKAYLDQNPNADPAELAEKLGWGFIEDAADRKTYQQTPDNLDDYILDLFGSMYKKSRIHISDGLIEREAGEVQDRMHVSIDRVSGGANEGALFNNQVLTSTRAPFPVTISIQSPYDYELKWLEKTLIAIHLGILLLGSSKSSGRLEVTEFKVTADYQHYFTKLQQEIAR